MREPILSRRALLLPLVGILLLAGCAAPTREEVSQQMRELQCMHEASNRPDEFQRRVECQHRARMGLPPASDPLDP